MNQMTTRVKTSQFEQSHLIPALGKAYVASGTHDPEPTTLLCSCNGVFTDRFILD